MTPAHRAKLTMGSAALIAAMGMWEGASQFTVYADKLAYGIATVCRGHTGTDLAGQPLVVGTPFTKDECDKIDKYNAVKYSLAMSYCIGPDINQKMFDPLVLFSINVGVTGACGSRAVQLINAGEFVEGCTAIARGPKGEPVWSKAGGRYVPGLQNRRQWEAKWCLAGAAEM